MEQTPYLELDVHYRVDNSLQLDPVLSQFELIHTLTLSLYTL
jgi:hypothetical protein